MPKPLVAANWKMHKTLRETEEYLRRLLALVGAEPPVELAVCPPFTALARAAELLAGTPIALGAQNGHPQREGAFTGEVSMYQLADLGVKYVICGHSERRRLFGEADAFVAEKVRAAWAYGLVPILCVGETLEERRAGRAWEVVERQLSAALGDGLSGPLVIAYEPVWAIGTGVPAHPQDAQAMARRIRAWLLARYGPLGEEVRIQYGGSVKPENAREFLGLPEIQGALVGGASLDPESFWRIALSASAPSP
ncbi:MAG: triose-phosphate isomerase [Candidatus Bipolaricaulota bacterium]|nr:triose-phosphate isomerase [Candidatus Bipolaricaulota bacterium]MDW8151465.1 triose-phosphate isomerase [Candidatus Bipolaricaulota bacterium]